MTAACKEPQSELRIPVTMLSGFLGAGKTTLLRHLLQDASHGLHIGCIVNDVAAVNIDAKLVRAGRGGGSAGGSVPAANMADTIELANGCACCSLQEELFMSFEALLAVSDDRGVPYDRLILENSGVAEPHNIRDLFQDSVGLPIMQRIRLDTMVTVVDSATFLPAYSTATPTALRPDLGPSGSLRPVVDLLVEQLECADYVLLNKTDLLAPGQLPPLQAVVSSINPLATVVACRNGAVTADQVFSRPAKALAAKLNIEAQHRASVAAALADGAQPAKKPKMDSTADTHAHGHEKGRNSTGREGGEHKHEHKEEHKHEGKHGHDHKHTHDHGKDGHKHDHGHCHKHEHGEDHSHKHDHRHDHDHDHAAHQESTAEQRFGIRSFVYARRRPFHPQRLQDLVLQWLPVKTMKALHGETVNPTPGDSAIKLVLRSKGFMWLSHSHETAFYWSHAGQHFEIRDEGDWWDAVPRDLWPPGEKQRASIMSDFDGGPHGDRRQEIVFIGARMEKERINAQLDAALLSDDEMAAYTANWET